MQLGCSRCGGPFCLAGEVRFTLLVRVSPQEALCGPCWRRAGQPVGSSAGDVAAAELRAHQAMLKRGGEDRYRVRAGKA